MFWPIHWSFESKVQAKVKVSFINEVWLTVSNGNFFGGLILQTLDLTVDLSAASAAAEE